MVMCVYNIVYWRSKQEDLKFKIDLGYNSKNLTEEEGDEEAEKQVLWES